MRSYVMVKPGFANNPEIIEYVKKTLKENGLNIVESEYVRYDKKAAEQHYAEHISKPFYPALEEYITSDKAYGMIVKGQGSIIAKIRALCGSTQNPKEGTIREAVPRLFGVNTTITKNVVHSSDSFNAAQKEIAIFNMLCMNKEILKV